MYNSTEKLNMSVANPAAGWEGEGEWGWDAQKHEMYAALFMTYF